MTVFKKSALESFSELKSFTSLQKSACTNCDQFQNNVGQC